MVLAVIVPTYNERENVEEVVRRLRQCLGPLAWEVIFVDDDSPDGTAGEVRRIAARDPHVRCLQRIGRRGLSSACIEGMLATAAPYLAVMDADLQHDETLLPRMLDILQQGETDIVVGSRYVAGGGVGDWKQSRIRISRIANSLSRAIFRADLSDRMSGFFMVRRDAFEAAARNLSGVGFKILLDLFASSPRPLRYRELPYKFRRRHAGVSKLDAQAAWAYLMLLLDKLFGRFLPVRMTSFLLVGGFGVLVHLAVLVAVFKGAGQSFVASQWTATLVAMVSNFALNNALTYRDVRLRGWRWFRGLISFVLACGIGAVANVGVASYLFEQHTQWTLSALAGVAVSTVWNYTITSLYTWNSPAAPRA